MTIKIDYLEPGDTFVLSDEADMYSAFIDLKYRDSRPTHTEPIEHTGAIACHGATLAREDMVVSRDRANALRDHVLRALSAYEEQPQYHLTHPEIIHHIAKLFVEKVFARLGPSERQAVRNHPLSNECCRSHDFLDPNPLMVEAFEMVLQREWQGTRDEDVDYMNQAWTLARQAEWFGL